MPPWIVVGGQTKHVGKTTLVCEIVRRFASASWTAAKITSHIHDAEDCRRIAAGSSWSICEQWRSNSNADTARYLRAGAVRSLLVCAESGSLDKACAVLKKEVSSDATVIVESTAAVPLLAPDLFLLVVNPASEDFKVSAADQLMCADALVSSGASNLPSNAYVNNVPIFPTADHGLDPALVNMIEKLCNK